jgi:hypothetical protein
MTSSLEHLDRALAEEFAGHGETIHRLKTTDAHFKHLMALNHDLWTQIQNMQSGVTPADDATRHELEKKRLKLLDEIGTIIRAAES